MSDMSKLNISNAEVEQALEKRFGSVDFKLLQWKTISFNEEGKLGYLGDHFRIETKVQRNGQEKDVSFFVKTLPANEHQRILIEKTSLFRKEALFFSLLADKLDTILAKAGRAKPGSEVSVVIPKCYLVRDDALLMENLQASNFAGKDASVSLTLDFFLVTIRTLARFHAASIALEEELGKPLNEAYPDLDFETFLDMSPDFYLASWHAASIDSAQTLIPMVEKYKGNPDIVKKAVDAFPLLFKTLTKKIRQWPNARNVFCHGDLWINNALFRFDEAGNPLEAVLVDFQLLRYAPPATDILIFLMFSADKEFRDKNFDTVVREYYNELSRTLLALDIQPEKVLPWEELQRTLKEMWQYCLVLMAGEYPLALAPSEAMDPILKDSKKFHQHFMVNRTPFAVKMFEENANFRSRYTEVVEELIDDYIVKS